VKTRVIGIDPGLRNLGWGILDMDGSRLHFVACGTCRSTGNDLAERLLSLHDGLTCVIQTHRPDSAAVEQTFVNKDGAATLKLGQARGIALLVPAQFGLPVAEYAPNSVKKSVVGVGHATKEQVQKMVRVQLPNCTYDSHDAADALAVAIAHAHSAQSNTHLNDAIARSIREVRA